MPGIGTVINVAAILAGGTAGLLFGKIIRSQVQDGLCTACGIATLFLGLAGAMEGMLSAQDGKIVSGGTMLVIGCLVLGALVGELLNLEDKMERFGQWLKEKTGNAGFVDAFVTASLTVCIGAMAIVGSIQDGIRGNYSILTAKAVLDFILVMVMTCSMGKGCLFSAIPVAVFQGSITALAGLVAPLMTDAALNNLSFIGSILRGSQPDLGKEHPGGKSPARSGVCGCRRISVIKNRFTSWRSGVDKMIKLGYSIDTRGATSRSVPPALGLRSSRWLGGVAATSY